MTKIFRFGAIGYLLLTVLIWWLHPLVLFRPTTLPPDYRFQFPQSFQELNFANREANLNALWFPKTSLPDSLRRGAVLFFHGNRDNLARWGKEYAPRFLARGYEVLMYDYRGYGKSTGLRSEAALHQDAQLMYDYLKKHISEDSIIVYGYSLGTGMAAHLAAHNRPRILILEAPYASIPTLGHTHLPLFPYEWLTRYKFRTDSCLAHVSCPIYIFHGTRDRTVPYQNSQILQRLYPSKIQLTTIPNGSHRRLDTFALYQTQLRRLLLP